MTSNVPEEQGPQPASEPSQPPPAAGWSDVAAPGSGPSGPPPSSQEAYGSQPAQYASQGQPPAPTYPGQTAPMSASDERMWGMFAHLAPFVGAFVGLPVLGPLVVFLIYKDRSAFVRANALESLNFQLTLLIGYIISAVLVLVLVGFFTAAIIGIASIVLQILAAVAANRGEEYHYPLTIRFVH